MSISIHQHPRKETHFLLGLCSRIKRKEFEVRYADIAEDIWLRKDLTGPAHAHPITKEGQKSKLHVNQSN